MHVPKCAGVTVEQYFVRLGVPNYNWSWRFSPLRKHYLAKAVNLFPNYFTFAFVRNPFDRFVSYYFHGLRLCQDANRRLSYKNMHECIELAAELLAVNETDLKAAKFGPRQVEGSALEGYEWYHAKRQTEFLLDCNPASYFGVRRFNDDPCSFIGRQESFDKDFACLLNILGIDRGGRQLPTESRNVSPQRMIDGQRRHYSYYYDKTSRRMIEELYARDLEFLGYEFEEDGVVSVLNPLYDLQAARRKRGERVPLRQWVTVSPRRVAWTIYTVWRKFPNYIGELTKLREISPQACNFAKYEN